VIIYDDFWAILIILDLFFDPETLGLGGLWILGFEIESLVGIPGLQFLLALLFISSEISQWKSALDLFLTLCLSTGWFLPHYIFRYISKTVQDRRTVSITVG